MKYQRPDFNDALARAQMAVNSQPELQAKLLTCSMDLENLIKQHPNQETVLWIIALDLIQAKLMNNARGIIDAVITEEINERTTSS
jgi:hypothetical protein